MKTICFYLEAHQPYKFRKYRFFDIGKQHNYIHEEISAEAVRSAARNCYVPLNRLLEKLLDEQQGRFRLATGLSGILGEQLAAYAPEGLHTFRRLAGREGVEFVGEPYAHSLASLGDTDEFIRQIEKQNKWLKNEFGQTPKTFRNTELIFNDHIAETVGKQGFRTIVTEGAPALLEWRSPNYRYCARADEKLNLLARNIPLSDEIALHFSDGPGLTAERLIDRIKYVEDGELINIFLDYETFGEYHSAGSGIFDFLKAFVEKVCADGELRFATPDETAGILECRGALGTAAPVSWANSGRNLSTWLDNELQREVFRQVYSIGEELREAGSEDLFHLWDLLQPSDNLCEMSMVPEYRNRRRNRSYEYESPYDAFINYMNILTDVMQTLIEVPEKPAKKISSKAVRTPKKEKRAEQSR